MDNRITLIGRETSVLSHDIKHIIEANSTVSINILNPDEFIKGNYDASSLFLVTYQYDMSLRKQIIDLLNERSLARATFIHPLAVVDPTATVQPGTFIGPFCVLGYQSSVHGDCIVSPYTLIGHRSELGEGSVTNPGAMIAGTVKVGKYCLLGIKCVTIDHLDICDNTVVGPTAFITKSIAIPGGRYLGNPARRVDN